MLTQERSQQLIQSIHKWLYESQKWWRTPLSKRYPKLKPIIIYLKCKLKHIRNCISYQISRSIQYTNLQYRYVKHQSLLMRKLWDSDIRLQKQKVINLQNAIQYIDWIIIKPWETFSLWELVWPTTEKRGFVKWMLLSDWKVIEWLWWGLCQLSNLLHWMFLHTNLDIVERYHHSLDTFPDSSRTLPFWSWATILYNFIDLKCTNNTNNVYQIRLQVTDKHLKWQIYCDHEKVENYHIVEENHCFINYEWKWYRYNELYKEKVVNNMIVSKEKILENLSPTLYTVTDDYLHKNNYTFYRL